MNPIKHEHDEEEQIAFLPTSRPKESDDESVSETSPSRRVRSYLRWIIEICMAITIVFLLLRPQRDSTSKRRSPVPVCVFAETDLRARANEADRLASRRRLVPRKVYTFHQNETFMNKEMFYNELDTLHTLHHWIPLSSG
jgi:hypothetical protein